MSDKSWVFSLFPLHCSQCAFSIFILQFAMWVDAVIFVFSLEDEVSFQTVYHYYSRMANYRNTSEIPMVLVGTQGKCILYYMQTHAGCSKLVVPCPVLSHQCCPTHLIVRACVKLTGIQQGDLLTSGFPWLACNRALALQGLVSEGRQMATWCPWDAVGPCI